MVVESISFSPLLLPLLILFDSEDLKLAAAAALIVFVVAMLGQ